MLWLAFSAYIVNIFTWFSKKDFAASEPIRSLTCLCPWQQHTFTQDGFCSPQSFFSKNCLATFYSSPESTVSSSLWAGAEKQTRPKGQSVFKFAAFGLQKLNPLRARKRVSEMQNTIHGGKLNKFPEPRWLKDFSGQRPGKQRKRRWDFRVSGTVGHGPTP